MTNIQDNFKTDVIDETLSSILSLCSKNEIEKIYLFNQKLSLNGNITSFKLCLITEEFADKLSIEKQIYLHTNCPIPFDLVSYTKPQFEQAITNESSFATKIQNTGRMIYEKK